MILRGLHEITRETVPAWPDGVANDGGWACYTTYGETLIAIYYVFCFPHWRYEFWDYAGGKRLNHGQYQSLNDALEDLPRKVMLAWL